LEIKKPEIMRITLGSDHAGFELKQILAYNLQQHGHQVLDLGTNSTQPVDYPDYAEAVGLSVAKGEADRGILICGSGVGASVAVNKIPGIRAGLCHDTYSAHQGVEHDDVNVLVLGSRVIGTELAKEISLAFLNARFTKEERHQRRLNKVLAIEERYAAAPTMKEKKL
jgi:ribose 5-phosphate isomerase B